jgi:transcriptional regulator with XRE-family HTH domain
MAVKVRERTEETAAKTTNKPKPKAVKKSAPISVTSSSAGKKAVGKSAQPSITATPPRRKTGGAKTIATVGSARPKDDSRGDRVAAARRELGVTQEIFARMIGVSARSIAGWERGSAINDGFYRRVLEMERLAKVLKKAMKTSFIPRWLATPSEGLGGLSPIETLERGQNDRFWRTVFLLGSGLPV